MADNVVTSLVVDKEFVTITTNPESNIINIKVTSENRIRFSFHQEKNENEVAVVFLDD